MRAYLSTLAFILAAAEAFATTPPATKAPAAEPAPPQQATPADSSKPPAAKPATTFTPSEKVGADSAVSFPVDI